MIRLLWLLLFLSGPASAFELKRDSTGSPVRWAGGPTLVAGEHFAEQLEEAGAFSAVKAAIETISGAMPGLGASSSQGRSLELGFDPSEGATNQHRQVVLEEWPYDAEALAITITTYDRRTHAIVDADIAFNGEREFKVLAPGSSDRTNDIQNTLTHELGHAMGLAHNPANEAAVMYPRAPPGEVSKRMLAEDDREGLSYLYPANVMAPAVGCSASAAGADLLAACATLLLALKRRRLSALLLLVPAIASASAPERPRSPVVEMRAKAQVAGARAFARGGLIFTELELEVSACAQGDCPPRLIVVVPGGRLGDLEQVVGEHAAPRAGDPLDVSREWTATKGSVVRVQADGAAGSK